jgi:hypothetical protein
MLRVFAFIIVMVSCIGVTSVGYADTEPPPPPPPSPAPAKVWAYSRLGDLPIVAILSLVR